MRNARIKVDQVDTWYHCYNRIAGTSLDRPFGDADKEQFVRILHRVSLLYSIQVVAYQVMSNHYHLLVHAPAEPCSTEEICRRYHAFHRGKKELEPNSPACHRWQQRARDISWFMRHLQQLFTMWFNRSRAVRRRGSLWADRFKHSILEGGEAVWACWVYIENNPVRACMVNHPGDYRFCSYGVWIKSGRHPFAEHVQHKMLPMVGLNDIKDLRATLTAALGNNTHLGTTSATLRRMRYWVDGLVIGSELFVRSVMASHHPRAAIRRIERTAMADPPLACWRRLRSAT